MNLWAKLGLDLQWIAIRFIADKESFSTFFKMIKTRNAKNAKLCPITLSMSYLAEQLTLNQWVPGSNP